MLKYCHYCISKFEFCLITVCASLTFPNSQRFRGKMPPFTKVALYFAILTLCSCEIHRARNNPKGPNRVPSRVDSSPRPVWPPGSDDSFRVMKEEAISQNEGIVSISSNDRFVWFYSLVSAALVGLSGIFPLVIIPLDSGESLKRGGKKRKNNIFFVICLIFHSIFL